MSMSLFLLASKSPRRFHLLSEAGCTFEVIDSQIDESIYPNETPTHYVSRMARTKAEIGFNKSSQKYSVLGADTVVVFNNMVFGKPKNFEDSTRILRCLSGRTHQVYTAIGLFGSSGYFSDLVCTEVVFREISDEEIEEYWKTGEPVDKAGSYAIQGIGRKFVKNINGSQSNVIGLPVEETLNLLQRHL